MDRLVGCNSFYLFKEGPGGGDRCGFWGRHLWVWPAVPIPAPPPPRPSSGGSLPCPCAHARSTLDLLLTSPAGPPFPADSPSEWATAGYKPATYCVLSTDTGVRVELRDFAW